MFYNILPKQIDNIYNGHKLALWLFGVVVFMKSLQNLLVLFNGYSIIKSADGIPLDTYTPAGAETVVAVIALLGFTRIILYLLSLLVLIRFRSLITFMFALLGFEYLGRELILYFLPIIRSGTPVAPVVNLILFFLTIIGLALSLWKQSKLQSSE